MKMLLSILKIIASVATVATGLVSMLWPLQVQGFTGLTAQGGRGVTEIRTVLGALFIGLGIAVLYYRLPETYVVLGVMYLVMAVVRTISMVVDDSVMQSNIISIIAELVFGIILVV